MPSNRVQESIRCDWRTVQPPRSTEGLRRAIAARPGGVILESVGRVGSSGRYSIFAADPVREARVSWAGEVDPFLQLSRICRPWVCLENTPDLPFLGGWIGYLAYEAGRFIEPSAARRAPRAASVHHEHGHLNYRVHRGIDPPLAHWALYDTVLVHDGLTDRWIAAGMALPRRIARRDRPSVAERLGALEQLVAETPRAETTRADALTHATPAGIAGSTGKQSLPVAPRHATPAGIADWMPARGVSILRPPDSAGVVGQWNYSREAYMEKVERALEYVRAGEIFQVNLSRRWRADVTGDPIALYQQLCEANPAAYAAFLRIPAVSGGTGSPRAGDGGSVAVLSSSPELFLRVRGREVMTRPIKGTRPRGKTSALDAAARAALAHSAKDRAELNMIIDLERNDLGRVCEFGSIRVAHDGEIEALPTVFHRTATVVGRLRDGADAIDLLRASFPGGSVTGAPKVRAMQIINELEPDPRGPYCGAVGYIGLDGDLTLNLGIRTMSVVVEGSRIQGFEDSRGQTRLVVDMHVGSGIVADSDPEDEYAELAAKAAGMFAALRQEDRPPSMSPRPWSGGSPEVPVKEPPTLVGG